MAYTYLVLLLEEHLVVLGERGAKDDTRDALKRVNPLFALGALAADVEHVYSAKAEECRRAAVAGDGSKEGTYDRVPMLNRVSVMPVLFARARRTSSLVGT